MSINVPIVAYAVSYDGKKYGKYPAGDGLIGEGWSITDLVAVSPSASTVDLTWTLQGAIDVQYFPTGGGDWVTAASNQTIDNYQVTGLPNNAGTDHSFRIKQFGVAAYSNEAYAATSTPVFITDLLISAVGTTTLDLTWTADGTVDVEYSSNSGQSYSVAASGETGSSYQITGLSSGQQYYVRLRQDGTNIFSNVAIQSTQNTGGAGTVFFQDDLASGFSSTWDRTNAAKWTQQDGFVRALYDDGETTSGTQLRYAYQAGDSPREIFLKYDMKWGATQNSPKTLKFFGEHNGSGGVSNMTFQAHYKRSNYSGPTYGNNTGASAANDNFWSLRTDGTFQETDTNSPSRTISVADIIPFSTAWRTFHVHWKQNTDNALADGECDIWVDGVLKLSVRNFKNCNADHLEFESMTFGDYTQALTTHWIDLRNVVMSKNGWPTGGGP